VETPAEQRIQPLRAACNRLAVELLVVFGAMSRGKIDNPPCSMMKSW
jgi:hypothetical protein